MNITNNLISLLKKVSDCTNYNLLFNDIAQEILTNYVIKKGDKEYAIVEIEFYFYSKTHPDVITYPRRVDVGHWFFHQSGVDLTFQSNGDEFGGILIRGIKDLSDGYNFFGPQKCVDVLWDSFNAFNPKVEEYPRLEYKENISSNAIHKYKRWIPVKESDRKRRISEWKKRIEHNFSPLPDASIDNIEEQVFNSYYRFSTIPLHIIKWGYSAIPKPSDKYSDQQQDSISKIPLPVSATKISEGKPTVYLSTLLASRYAETCKRLTDILNRHNIPFAFFEGTKDIWCRDYMPVQTPSGKLIQFKYDPSYLKDPKYSQSRSDIRYVDEVNNIKPIFSDINLDGGNVVMSGNKAIITDRIFSENPDWDKERLINELSTLLECEIIILPAYKPDYDFTGHADGMIRFVDENTVLVNNLDQDFKYMREAIVKALEKANLKYINFPWFEHKIKGNNEHAIGIYLNYLEIDNLIVMPVFGVQGNRDAEALAKLKEVFPDKIIETIDYNDIALTGGILNCTTWTMRKQ